MLYGQELGKDQQFILEQARRTGMPIPETFKSAPELLQGLDVYYTAFLELNSCRSSGQGYIGPISWLAMVQYCEACGIEGEQAEDLLYHVSAMDEAFIKLRVKQIKQETESAMQAARAKGGKK